MPVIPANVTAATQPQLWNLAFRLWGIVSIDPINPAERRIWREARDELFFVLLELKMRGTQLELLVSPGE